MAGERKLTFREHEVHVKARTHDYAARVHFPRSEGGYRDFFGPTEADVEQQARDFIKERRPWRDADVEPEVA